MTNKEEDSAVIFWLEGAKKRKDDPDIFYVSEELHDWLEDRNQGWKVVGIRFIRDENDPDKWARTVGLYTMKAPMSRRIDQTHG